MNNIINKPLLEDIKALLQTLRQHLQQTINTTMVQIYWNIGIDKKDLFSFLSVKIDLETER